MKIQNISSTNYTNRYSPKNKTNAPAFGDNIYASIEVRCANICTCKNFVEQLRRLFTAFVIKIGKIEENHVLDFIPMPESKTRLGLYLFDGTETEANELIEKMSSPIDLIKFLERMRTNHEVTEVKFSIPLEEDLCLMCPDKNAINTVVLN